MYRTEQNCLVFPNLKLWTNSQESRYGEWSLQTAGQRMLADIITWSKEESTAMCGTTLSRDLGDVPPVGFAFHGVITKSGTINKCPTHLGLHPYMSFIDSEPCEIHQPLLIPLRPRGFVEDVESTYVCSFLRKVSVVMDHQGICTCLDLPVCSW